MIRALSLKLLCHNHILLLLLVWMSFAEPAQNSTSSVNQSKTNSKKGKQLFSLFSVVQFGNDVCKSQSAFATGQSKNRTGSCFSSSECTSKGGIGSGNCASGFGVCCVFLYTAPGGTIAQNCSYIQNPGFPSAYASTNALTYNIKKSTSDVCYLRLDFETFVLLGPDTSGATTGKCSLDSFKVTTANTIIPTICGINIGQHIYVDIGNQASDKATLNFVFNTASTIRNWEIKVTQIECSNPGRPPSGCLQYWTSLTGRITTFNFLPKPVSVHLASQDVTACIRRQEGFCCIQYQVCSDVANAFALEATNTPAALVDSKCTLDYVAIPGSGINCSQGRGTLTSKYCGAYLNPSGVSANVPVCACTSPFFVHFHTESVTGSNPPDIGACLDFAQIPCNT